MGYDLQSISDDRLGRRRWPFLRAALVAVAAAGVAVIASVACSSPTSSDAADSVTRTVTDQGAVLSLGDVALEIPPGALSASQSITMTRTSEAAPPGYEASSALYRFEPEGLVFAKPAVLSIAAASKASIIWSQGPDVYEPLPTSFADGRALASIVHFSRGFLGTPACEHASSCAVEGAKCTYFESRCDANHDKQKRDDCDCAGAGWKCNMRETPCRAGPDAGGEAGSDAADAAMQNDGGLPPSGLVAWYRFDDLGGTTAANSGTAGSSLDGAVGTGVSMGAAGKVGGAFHFDGSASSLVTITDPGASPLDMRDAMTIELWVRPDTIDQPSTIMSKMSPATLANDPSSCDADPYDGSYPSGCGGSNGYVFGLQVPTYPTAGYGRSWLRWQIYTPADPDAGTTRTGGSFPAGPIAAATWYHVALVATGSLSSNHGTLYFNGTSGGSGGCLVAGPGVCNFLPTNDVPLTIGGASFGSFRGRLDEIKIWNVARTAAEVCTDAGGTFGASGCSL